MTTLDQNLLPLNAGTVFWNEPLSRHCTWRIGGPADALVCPQTAEQLQTLRRCIRAHGLPAVTIGQGSNLLFDDAGFRGVVIKIGRAFSDLQITGDTVRVQTGVSAARLARACQQAGLSGLEHIVGIPGTLGGLIAMNGGSLQQNIGQTVHTVTAMDAAGELRTFAQNDCRFEYRKSMFQDTDWIILDAVLKLQPDDPKAVHVRMLDILRQRRRKFPRRQPNCGSVFLSTPQMHATIGPPGRVIEEAGLKGCTVGGAQVSGRHANFIINTGGATADDVCRLVQQIRRTVHQKTGVWLQCEARKVSPYGQIQPLHQCINESAERRHG